MHSKAPFQRIARNVALLCLGLFASWRVVLTQGSSEPSVITAVRVGVPPVMDGILDDSVWKAAVTLDYGFSTKLNSSLFTQWKSEEKNLNFNWRIHWIPVIGSDVYFVYNHLLGTEGRVASQRATILAKVAYRFVI